MKIKDVSIPLAIIISSLILGGFLYAIQINKQNSIERQRVYVDSFGNELKCQNLLKDLKNKWHNVVGIYYSDFWNTCMVKYTEGGEVLEGRIESMIDKRR